MSYLPIPRHISSRRRLLSSLSLAGLGALLPPTFGQSRRELPLSTRFVGEDKFRRIVKKANTENWSALPMGERVIKVARELHGTPYENFTLEIDDHVEAPSANFNGLDCWTFFEISLGIARMLSDKGSTYDAEDLLHEIQFTRYRGGICTGNYLERIHYLAEWFFENDARGTCRHITGDLPGAATITGRRISEMTVLWKHYRYLKNNPKLRTPMGELEAEIAKLPVRYIPTSKVAAIEPKLQNGDVIGIATKHHGGFCSHVGLAIRTDDGVMRLMHASRDYRKVVIDKSISGYLKKYSKHAGIIVGRPLPLTETVTDKEQYLKNLRSLVS